MPFISTKVSCELTKEKEEILKKRFGESIALIGKSEGWLMLGFEDNCRLWFKGNQNGDSAYIEVSLFGKAGAAQYEKLTAAITDAVSEELPIAPDRIYVKYEEASTWGWNGGNF